MELNKYFNSETREVKRSEIALSNYNPRSISADGKKALKRSIKRFGIVGGIVVNIQTGNTVVGGHQKVSILDDINNYDIDTQENDYTLKAEFIDVDSKTEKELNIVLNNPNVGGSWDFDKLRELIPDIDYKSAGLTEEDLSLIGVDYLFQTEEESNLADSLTSMMGEVDEQNKKDISQRKLERAEKVEAMKAVKQEVKEKAESKAKDMDAYVMISFDSFEAKASFMERFGYNEYEKFLKGEVFSEQVERVD